MAHHSLPNDTCPRLARLAVPGVRGLLAWSKDRLLISPSLPTANPAQFGFQKQDVFCMLNPGKFCFFSSCVASSQSPREGCTSCLGFHFLLSQIEPGAEAPLAPGSAPCIKSSRISCSSPRWAPSQGQARGILVSAVSSHFSRLSVSLLMTPPGFVAPVVWSLPQDNKLVVGEAEAAGVGFVHREVCGSGTLSAFPISLFSLCRGITLSLCNGFIVLISSAIRNRSLLKSVNKR